jgi:hypothetical protein
MEGLIGLLVTVIILGLVFYVLYWLLGRIPLPAPFAVIAQVILGLIVVVVLLGLLFGGISIPVLRIGR